MKTVLITGCAGFIGYHLANKLLSKNNIKVIGIDNLNKFTGIKIKRDRLTILLKYKFFKFHKLNINDTKNLEKIFKKNKFDTVINLAALAGVRNSIKFPKLYLSSNINGFYNIIELSEKYKVKKFLFASSSSVYGNLSKFPTLENMPTFKQESFYALTKKLNELISDFISQKTNMQIIGLRFFTVYGQYGRPDMFLKKVVDAILNNKTCEIYGYGNHYRDFTYIDDVVNLLNYMIFTNPKNSRNFNIYNIGNGNKVSLKSILNLIEKIIGKKGNYKYIEQQKGDVLITHSSNKLIQKDFKKLKFTNIKKGISKYIEWHKKYYS